MERISFPLPAGERDKGRGEKHKENEKKLFCQTDYAMLDLQNFNLSSFVPPLHFMLKIPPEAGERGDRG